VPLAGGAGHRAPHGKRLEIFAALPVFGDKIPQRDVLMPPEAVRLGGWLGGALQWHLTFAWLFVVSGAIYVIYQAASGNYRQVLFARPDVRGVWPMVRHYSSLVRSLQGTPRTIRYRSWPTQRPSA